MSWTLFGGRVPSLGRVPASDYTRPARNPAQPLGSMLRVLLLLVAFPTLVSAVSPSCSTDVSTLAGGVVGAIVAVAAASAADLASVAPRVQLAELKHQARQVDGRLRTTPPQNPEHATLVASLAELRSKMQELRSENKRLHSDTRSEYKQLHSRTHGAVMSVGQRVALSAARAEALFADSARVPAEDCPPHSPRPRNLLLALFRRTRHASSSSRTPTTHASSSSRRPTTPLPSARRSLVRCLRPHP